MSTGGQDEGMPGDARPPPGWMMVPARVIAVIIVVPTRLAWELLSAIRQTLWEWVLQPIGRFTLWLTDLIATILARCLVFLWTTFLLPIVHALAWVWRGFAGLLGWIGRGVIAIATLLGVVLGRAIRWLGGQLSRFALGPLAWLARILVLNPARWVTRWLLRPAAHVIAYVVRPLVSLTRALWHGVARLARAGRAIWMLARSRIVAARRWLVAATTRMAALAGHVWAVVALLVVVPVVRAMQRVAALVSGAIGAVLGQAWLLCTAVANAIGSVLQPVFIRGLWRPIGRAIRAVASTILRALRWADNRIARPLWRAILWLSRTLVAAPIRWAHRQLAIPLGRAVRTAWRASVTQPIRWANRIVIAPIRQASREVIRAIGLRRRERPAAGDQPRPPDQAAREPGVRRPSGKPGSHFPQG